MPLLEPNRPVTPRDLERLRRKLGHLVNDFCFLLGISMSKWSKLKKRLDDPIDDPGLAILARILDAHPEYDLVPTPPSASDVFETLVSFKPYANMPRRAFGIYFGRDASASYRWLEQNQHTGPVTNRLLTVMDRFLADKGVPGLDEWNEIVSIEATARGIPEIWREGLWRQRGSQAADDGEDAQKPAGKKKTAKRTRTKLKARAKAD